MRPHRPFYCEFIWKKHGRDIVRERLSSVRCYKFDENLLFRWGKCERIFWCYFLLLFYFSVVRWVVFCFGFSSTSHFSLDMHKTIIHTYTERDTATSHEPQTNVSQSVFAKQWTHFGYDDTQPNHMAYAEYWILHSMKALSTLNLKPTNANQVIYPSRNAIAFQKIIIIQSHLSHKVCAHRVLHTLDKGDRQEFYLFCTLNPWSFRWFLGWWH